MKLRGNYPEKIQTYSPSTSTLLGDYDYIELHVDDSGKVLNQPALDDHKEHFVGVRYHGDLDCLLKPLPADVLRVLGSRRVADFEGLHVSRSRTGRDDEVSLYTSGTRATSFYGLPYLMGKKLSKKGVHVVTASDADAFVKDFSRFAPFRPKVGVIAKWFMHEYVHPRDSVLHYDIPVEVMKLFYEHGRGGVFDVSMIGTRRGVKVDQNMAYLSVMALLESPRENVFRGCFWVNDGKYSPDDSFGLYNIDCYISDTLMDTPVYKEIAGVVVPLRGMLKDLTVLKPTMDCIKLLESFGLAKVNTIHWAWRFKSFSKHRPFKLLHDVLYYNKTNAVESKAFWKFVPCAVWGSTLETYTNYDGAGVPHLWGGFWFNPILGYTTTDLIRANNFRMKLKSSGLVTAEVVDMLIGRDGDWYKGENVKVKGPFDYTSINDQYHVSPEDDKSNLLDILRECKASQMKVAYKTRESLSAFRYYGVDAKKVFGTIRDGSKSIGHNTKRREPRELRGMPMKELLNVQLPCVPFTEEEAIVSATLGEVESNPFDLVHKMDFLGLLLEEGKTW